MKVVDNAACHMFVCLRHYGLLTHPIIVAPTLNGEFNWSVWIEAL